MVFWLSSYTLFFILDYCTSSQYLRERAFSWPQTPVKAVIIFSIIASIWYTLTSQTPVKTPIPITFFIIGILSFTLTPFSAFYLVFAYILTITGFVSGIIAALYYAGRTTVPTSLTPMLRAGSQIFTGGILLFSVQMLFVLTEIAPWSPIPSKLLVYTLIILRPFLTTEGIFLVVIVLPLGWLLIGLGYHQFRHQDRIPNTKAEHRTLTHWRTNSGTLLFSLAIISLICCIPLNPLNILSWLFLTSIILQLFIGLRLRMWNAPEFTMPAEVMIPGY